MALLLYCSGIVWLCYCIALVLYGFGIVWLWHCMAQGWLSSAIIVRSLPSSTQVWGVCPRSALPHGPCCGGGECVPYNVTHTYIIHLTYGGCAIQSHTYNTYNITHTYNTTQFDSIPHITPYYTVQTIFTLNEMGENTMLDTIGTSRKTNILVQCICTNICIVLVIVFVFVKESPIVSYGI